MNHRERSQKLKACIFDLDGVLVDTAIFHYQAWKRLANSMGFDFSKEDNERLKGINRMASLKLILGWAGLEKSEEEMEQLATQKNEWYKEMISTIGAGDLLPGVECLLKELQGEGYLLAVGSASKNAEAILSKTEIRHYFNVVVDGNMVTESKPDPTVFLKGAALLSVAPQDCVVFEDAQAGIDAALRANMRVVGVGRDDELKGACDVVAGFHELDLKRLWSIVSRNAN